MHFYLLIDLEKTIIPWFGKTNHMLSGLLKDTFNKQGINLSREQWILLHRLHSTDGQKQNDLAVITNRDKTSLTRLINNMEDKKLVYRDKDLTDKRINRIFCSDDGKNLYLRTLPIIKEVADIVQKGLNGKELNTIMDVAKKVQNNIENHLTR